MPSNPDTVTTQCSGVFCGDRDRLCSELADAEHTLARELASVRQLYHLALAQLHEQGGQLDRLREQHRRLREEYRDVRQQAAGDDRRAA
jgi:hypothetical protein|tara:strand:+ start:229 stop:495 length:267 start_codon:yes stop_codon:yes gene_type:complete